MASPTGQVRGTRRGLKRPHGLRWLGFSLTRGLSGSATQGTQSQNGWLPREHAGTLHTSWRGYRWERWVAHWFFILWWEDRPTRCRREHGPPCRAGTPTRWKRQGRGAAGVRSRVREHAPQERVTGTGGIMDTPGGSLILHP